MRKEYNTSRLGLLLFMGVLLAAIWGVALYGVSEEGSSSGVVTYHVSVHPGAVSYGTHSTASVPMVSMPSMSHTAPMVSGGSVRSYAHHGHAAMPASRTSSGFRIHTLSSASVHSIGSGGGGGGGMTGSRGGSSSKGIHTSGGSFAVPVLALNTSSFASSGMQTGGRFARPHIRRVYENGDGEYDGEYNESTGLYWNEDEEVWQDTPPIGTIRDNGGVIEEWNGTAWVRKGDIADLGTPVGDTPWLWILLLAVAFALIRGRKVKFNS